MNLLYTPQRTVYQALQKVFVVRFFYVGELRENNCLVEKPIHDITRGYKRGTLTKTSDVEI